MNTTTTRNAAGGLLTWRVTEFDSDECAYGFRWDSERGWGRWRDEGDRVVRVKPVDESQVPAEYVAAVARERAGVLGGGR